MAAEVSLDLSFLQENLQYKAAELLFDLRDEGNTTQLVIDRMVQGVDELFESSLEIIKHKFRELAPSKGNKFSAEEVSSILDKFRGQSFFEGLKTEDAIATYLKSQNWLVPPDKIVLKTKQVLQKGTQRLLSIPVDVGYVVPFLSLLEKLLNMPEVLHCVDNPKPYEEGVFRSPLDGYYYRNHPVAKKYPGTLAIGTYVDDINTSDTASTKPVSGRFFYWQLLNVYPELKSTTKAINLLFCALAEVVKEHGYEKFLEDYIRGMQKLSSEEGVTFTINGKKRCFHGCHVCSSGDNPASANLAGFKESHFAERCCRHCMGSKEEISSLFSEKQFVLRSKETHEQHLRELEAYVAANCPKNERDPSVKYGVNSRSVMLKIPHCDVTCQFPQDLMHDTIHGTLKLHIVLLLNHAVNVKQSIALRTINERIIKLSAHFGVNKPSWIESRHISDKNLRQSAAETLALAQMLPFALSQHDDFFSGMESVCDTEHLKCFILRLNVLNLKMATEFSLRDIETLRTMTQTLNEHFISLYPDCDIPKLHYETHSGTQILLFGPLRHHWCLRFEAKHAGFKRTCKILHSYINIFASLSRRHQIKQAAQMLTATKGHRGPYLKTPNDCGKPTMKKVSTLKHHKQLLSEAFPGLKSAEYVKQYKFVVVQGVHYSKNDAFLISYQNNLPMLGEIASIYEYQSQIVFIYNKLVTEEFDLSLNAFKVSHQEELGIARTSILAHHHRIPFIRSLSANYVVITCTSYIAQQMCLS